MNCIYCGYNNSKVLDSRDCEDGKSIRRRRECLKCGKRFTTFERVESTPILVVKSNGNRQAFNIAKLKNGIIRACEKRPISAEQIDKMVANIEKQVSNCLKNEITSKEIGDMVIEELKKVDQVAYVRFASVYRKFADVSYFKSILDEFENGENK